MGPPTTMAAVLLLATVAHAQHEGFNVAPQAIHSGVVAFRRDQYRQAYDPAQQYAQQGQPPQASYQVSGAVGPQQNAPYAGAQQGYSQVISRPQAELPMQQQVFAAQPQPNPAFDSAGPPSFGPPTAHHQQLPSAGPEIQQPPANDGSAADPTYSAPRTSLQLAQLQQQPFQAFAQQPQQQSYLPQQPQQIQAYAQPQQQQQFQPPPAPASPFLPQQPPRGSYALAPHQQQQQYSAFYPQQQQQQQYAASPQQQPFYQQQPPVSPAVQNPFYGQQQPQQQGSYMQQQFQPQPLAQQPQYQQQPQQYQPQAQFQPQPQYQQVAPPQQQLPPQGYAQQPLPTAPQYSAPQPQLQPLQRPAAVIAPPPLVQQLPVAVARPAPPPLLQQRLEPLATAPPPPARFTPRVADVRDPVSAIAATARPHHAQPVPFETVTVIAVDSRVEQVADVSHTRAEAVLQPKKLRHKKKKLKKVLPTTVVETISIAQPPIVSVSAHHASHRIVTTTFPPSIAPPSVTRQQQQRVRPSTPPPAPPPATTRPASRVHKPSNRPSKLIELTTAAAVAAGGDKSPNDVFLQCCRETGIDAKCHSRCNFDTLTKKVLTGMFLGTDPCPQKNGRDMLSCAAQKGDHTPCCMERGVHTTAAKNKCLGFCVMTPGSTFQADISMLPCWAVLNDIKGCFKDAILDQLE